MASSERDQEMEEPATEQRLQRYATSTGTLLCAVAANILAVLNCCQLFRHAPGEAIRPMDITLWLFVIPMGAVCVVGLRLVAQRARHWLLSLLSILLALLTFQVGLATFRWIVDARDLILKP